MAEIMPDVFRVLYIVKPEAFDQYPQAYRDDTTEFPELVDDVEDESTAFVRNERTGESCKAEEFFLMHFVTRFTADIARRDDPRYAWQ